MRKVSINNAEEGAKLGKSIFNLQGNVLLSAGAKLNSKYIKRLRSLGISELFIEDEISYGVEVEDFISENTRLKAKVAIYNVLQKAATTNKVDREAVHSVARNLVEEVLANGRIMIDLTDIKSTDGYTYEHSVNVCTLSVIIAIGLGYDIRSIEELAVGAILHDIGKIKIPVEILNKPGKLTDSEYSTIKQHTVLGYKIIRESGNFGAFTKYLALTHHERVDGNGYPLGLDNSKLHDFAKIVSVADCFDAMTSDRVYRAKLHVVEAIEYLNSMSTYQFDYETVRCFMKYVAVFPVGTGVVLNNKMKGLVVHTNNVTSRPRVRIIYNEKNEKLEEYFEIDLMKELALSVEDVCEL